MTDNSDHPRQSQNRPGNRYGRARRDRPGLTPTPVAVSQLMMVLDSAVTIERESMTAALGWVLRPAAARTWARKPSCSRSMVPSAFQAAR
jgi:hypothetical protein